MFKHVTWLDGFAQPELLYEGGATVIFRAQRRSAPYSLIIKSHQSDFPQALELARLRHEHALLNELQGDGIVPTYPLECVDRRLLLVMADVGGQSLDKLVSERLDIGLVLRVAIALTEVLRRAHQLRIIHRDIKPHNILIDTAPLRVYLIDWGIASRMGAIRAYDEASIPREGTLAYMSPEQSGMIARSIDARADLYSLGVTLYELLTGNLPFTATDGETLLRSHLLEVPAPPHAVEPRVPPQLSSIVMKLLSKAAEDRYRSARGLQVDLAECLSRWKQGRDIEPFPLGRSDNFKELRIPKKLYGREADVEATLAAFRRIKRGAAEIVLVSGYAGVGKSAVVREARRGMKLDGARFVAGKFEQFHSAVPYASIIRAFRDLVNQIIGEGLIQSGLWVERVSNDLGQNAGVLTQFIPELDRLMGPRPPVAELAPKESESRFHLAVQTFIAATARPESPLILFLDDLQWADPSSQKLLERLLTDPEQRHLLVIGAYRDHDVELLEPLLRTVEVIAGSGAPVTRLDLRPLALGHVQRLVADALDATEAEVEVLAQEIYRKAGGSPFFVGQLLTSLVQDGLVLFDAESGLWRSDLAAIAARQVSASVAEFVAQRLQQLDAGTLELLQLAACLGTQCDHHTLAELAGLSTAECARRLWRAIMDGLIVPLDDDYRLLTEVADVRDESARGEGPRWAETGARVGYRFLHDRVQEAAYALIEARERAQIHLRIARLLRARPPSEDSSEGYFDVAEHWNIGRALVTDREERLAAAALDLLAGRQAKASVAYDAARGYLTAGVAFLPDDAWETAYELSFALRAEHAESVFLCGAREEASALFEEIDARADTMARKMDICLRQITLRLSASQWYEAVQLGRLATAALGAPLPEDDDGCVAACEAEISRVTQLLQERSIDDLLRAPPLQDHSTWSALKIFVLLDGASFIINPKLSGLISVRQILVSLESGPSEFAAHGYAAFALVLLRRFGRTAEVETCLRLAIAMNERYPNPTLAGKVSYLQGAITMSIKPFSEAITYFDQGVVHASQGGDLTALYSCVCLGQLLRFMSGVELSAIVRAIDPPLRMLRSAKFDFGVGVCRLLRQAALNLIGSTRSARSFGDDLFSEDEFLATTKNDGELMGYYGVLKLVTTAIHREHADAPALLEDLPALQRHVPPVFQAYVSFFACLELCALLEHATPTKAAQTRAALVERHAVVSQRRALCEANWACADTLIAAELARIDGKDDEAQMLYEEAIGFAEQSGFVHLFALSNELCGRFNQKRRYRMLAALCLSNAHEGWCRWGADAKARVLSAQSQGFVASRSGLPSQRVSTTSPSSTIRLQSVLFDLEEVMRAAYAISSEIQSEKVVEQFLKASSATATARRSLMALRRGDELVVAGEATSEPAEVRTGLAIPAAERADLPLSLIRYVAETGEGLSLTDTDDAASLTIEAPSSRWIRPRALLCLPMMHHGRPVGVWYAESDTVDALRQGVVDLMRMLVAQTANALENAYLYEQLQEKGQELALSNEHLEAEVVARTGELSEANERLRLELEERSRMERDRAALQERIIQMQEDALLELSSPLLPISDRILVVPLIGTIDERRARHMVDAIISGSHKRGTRILIVDVTGLRQTDTMTAEVFSRMASCLRLLGVRAVFTGIQPRIAQSLADWNIDLSGVVLQSTLQAGIEFAMRHSG